MIITSTVSPSLKLGLRFLGVWPDMPHSIFYRMIHMSTILVMQYFQYLYVFTNFEINDLSNIMDSLPAAFDYTLTIFKLIGLWANQGVIYQLLAAIDYDWRECINVKKHLYLMMMKGTVSHFFSKVMFTFSGASGVFFLLGDYVFSFLIGHNNTLRHFPLNIQFPFEAEQSPIFELLFVILFVHIMSNVYVVSILTVLIFTLVFHASGQIDIICDELYKISKKTSVHDSKSTIRMLIHRHNRIISFSSNIKKLFSFMALMQILWNTLVICCIGFLFIISARNGIEIILVAKAIFASGVIITEIFIFCFAGEYLILKSNTIGDAAYESLWYDLPINQSKIMILIIMRSQRQLTLTAGGVANLSLETFASIMKASASYISVLLAMY